MANYSTRETTIHANGKLLLTGEYLVLKGAKALAVPVTYGQSLEIKEGKLPGILHWIAYEKHNKWFEAKFKIPGLTLQTTTDIAIATRLQNMLKAATTLNSDFLKEEYSIFVKTNLEFNKDWGLGSSSTLIVNIARWADIDAFDLFKIISNGSGYDIACATARNPLIYQIKNDKPKVALGRMREKVKNSLFFIYQGSKQNSDEEIQRMFESIEGRNIDHSVKRITEITEMFTATSDVNEIMAIVEEHEGIIAEVLQRNPIKKELYPDFYGSVKSLGAWGGDFLMAVYNGNPADVYSYFKTKGLSTIFRYKDLVLDT